MKNTKASFYFTKFCQEINPLSKSDGSLFGKIIVMCAYAFLALPFCIFAFGWLKPAIGIPASVCVFFSLLLAIKSTPISWEFPFTKQNVRTLYLAAAAILLWVFLSGIGNFVYQNDDHKARNAVYTILVEKPWPISSIIEGTEIKLVYYLGFFLPAALVGKVLGLNAGFVFQYFWAVMGIFSLFYLVCVIQKRLSLKIIVIIIFFSGLDYIGSNLRKEYLLNPISRDHIELWSYFFQYSSMTTQLFWVFNQAIPAWIATALLLMQKSCKNIVFIMGTLLLNSIFPFIGLLPIAAFIGLRNIWFLKKEYKNIVCAVHESASIQNCIGGIVAGIITYLYLKTSTVVHLSSVNNPIKVDISSGQPFDANKYIYLFYGLFIVLEVGIYSALLFKNQKKNPLYYIVGLILLVLPVFRIIIGNNVVTRNFTMRISIPALFILMLFVINEIETIKIKTKRYYALVLALFIGGITPAHEFMRAVVDTYKRIETPFVTERQLLQAFGGEKYNFFFKYLAKK